MSKQQLIDSIQQHNPTANAEFLIYFDEAALHRYLHHLHYGKRPRGSQNLWIRGGETAAVVIRTR